MESVLPSERASSPSKLEDLRDRAASAKESNAPGGGSETACANPSMPDSTARKIQATVRIICGTPLRILDCKNRLQSRWLAVRCGRRRDCFKSASHCVYQKVICRGEHSRG